VTNRDVLDVEPSLGVRVHVLDLSRNGDGTTLLGLSEPDHSLDGGVSLENSDSLLVKGVSMRGESYSSNGQYEIESFQRGVSRPIGEFRPGAL